MKGHEKKERNSLLKKIGIVSLVIVLLLVCTFIVTEGKILEKAGIPSLLFEAGGYAYGDVDMDGTVTTKDAVLILQKIAGKKELSTKQIKIADVDGDKKLNQIDVQLILKKVGKRIQRFPIEEGKFGFEPGDVDQNGIVNTKDSTIIQKYIVNQTSLTEYQQVLANVSGDNEINELDAELILLFCTNKIREFPILNPEEKYYTLGDVDEDGEITSKDATMIQQYLVNLISLRMIQKLAADIDGDLKITEEDVRIILEMCSSKKIPEKEDDSNLSSSQQEEAMQEVVKEFIYGDVNEDGKVTTDDSFLVLQYTKGTFSLSSSQFQKADVNADQVVDALDAELISKYVIHVIPKLDPSEKYYLLGDVNGDGKVTSKDATMIQQALAGLKNLDEVAKKAADYNQDKNITNADVLAILQSLT